MNNVKIGDKLMIHCYKHNGRLYKVWQESIVLDINDLFMVIGNEHVQVKKVDGRAYYTKEPAIMFFYYDKWYNISAQLRSHGLFYKCDVASPFIIDNNIIKFIDYDLDLKVFPDGGFRVLDRNEYNYHKRIMKYTKEIDRVVRFSLTELINMKKANVNPFNKELIDKYFKIYKNLK